MTSRYILPQFVSVGIDIILNSSEIK